MSSESVGGTRITSIDRPSKKFAAGRVCLEPGCETRLSIYNNGKFCYTHEPRSVPRTRGKKIA